MITINRDNLEEGLMVTGRNNKSIFGKAIRAGVHSFTNHNAMVVKKNGEWFIAEAQPPVSTLTPIADYEKIMNEDGYLVRFYRLESLTVEQREGAARYFVDNLIGLPYPKKSRMIVLVMPLYNLLIDKIKWIPSIRLTWCSELDKRAFLSQDPDCLDGVDGKKKVMFSPKTFENRIMLGLFADCSGSIIVHS